MHEKCARATDGDERAALEALEALGEQKNADMKLKGKD